MIKIAMLGCDSSHTEAYASLLNDKQSAFYGKAKVEWLWGADKNQAYAKAASCAIPKVMNSLDDERLAEADLIMVVGRYGDSHFLPAKKAIETGKPVYVDKPFTNDYSEALQLKELSTVYNSNLRSFSPLRYSSEVLQVKKNMISFGDNFGAVVSGPAKTSAIISPGAEKLHFYGVHAVDILTAVFGTGVRKIKADMTDKGIWVSLTYSDGRHATLNLFFYGGEFYHLAVLGSSDAIATSIDPYGDFYVRTMDVLLSEIGDKEKSAVVLEQACEAIRILDTIEASIENQSEIILS